MKHYVHFPKVEGRASRQAHADLPEGTYEREVSKEGFFGPAAHLYHRHPPTAWVDFEGPLRPHAFDCTRLREGGDSPWDAAELLHAYAPPQPVRLLGVRIAGFEDVVEPPRPPAPPAVGQLVLDL